MSILLCHVVMRAGDVLGVQVILVPGYIRPEGTAVAVKMHSGLGSAKIGIHC